MNCSVQARPWLLDGACFSREQDLSTPADASVRSALYMPCTAHCTASKGGEPVATVGPHLHACLLLLLDIAGGALLHGLDANALQDGHEIHACQLRHAPCS